MYTKIMITLLSVIMIFVYMILKDYIDIEGTKLIFGVLHARNNLTT